MQKKRSNGINQGMIGEAIAMFVRNEATLLAQMAELAKVQVEAERRFVRIEGDLEQIKSILRHLTSTVERHEQILNNLPETIQHMFQQLLKELPEAIRQKIGFKTRQ